MENKFQKIEDSLKKVKPLTLSADMKAELWSRIQPRFGEAREVIPSPYLTFSFYMHTRVLVPALLVVLLISTGGTTALADGSRPGDFLFAIDRAAESVRLSFTSDEKRDDVRVAIAEERVSELESLIGEESSRRLARGGAARNAKQAPQPEMATFSIQADSDVAVESGDDAMNTDATLMMQATGEADAVPPQAEEATEDKDTESRNEDIQTALMLLSDISIELKEKGNEEAYNTVGRAIGRLNQKLNELPYEEGDSFKETIEREIPEASAEFETINVGPTPSDEGFTGVENPRPTLEVEVVIDEEIKIDGGPVPEILPVKSW
ncbi:MAG: DUF5667 domain-containing protein [Patescibacteria group bacterium]